MKTAPGFLQTAAITLAAATAVSGCSAGRRARQPPAPVEVTSGEPNRSGTGSATPLESSWFPMVAGATWSYRSRPNHPGLNQDVFTVHKTTTVQAAEPGLEPKPTAFLIRTEKSDGEVTVSRDAEVDGRIVRLDEWRLNHNPGPYRQDRVTSTPGKLRFDHNRMRVGESWTETFESSGVTAGLPAPNVRRVEQWTVQSLSDIVVVPAGQFLCARVRVAWNEVGGRRFEGKSGVKTYFFAQNVGKVAEATASSTEELESFSIPGAPPPLPVPSTPPSSPVSALLACNNTGSRSGWPNNQRPTPSPAPEPERRAPLPVSPPGGSARGHFGVTVLQPTPPPSLSGGTLLVLRDGRTAVASDPDRDRIWVVDLAEERLAAEVVLRAGDEPGRLVEDRAGRVHAVLRRGGDLVTLDPACWAVSARRPVCAAPRGLDHEPAADLLHVACAGGELVSLPAANGEPVRTLTLERDLRDVLVASDGRLKVSTFRNAELLVLDASGAVTERLRPTAARSLARPRPRGIAPNDDPFVPSVAWRAIRSPDGEGALLLHQRAFSGVMGSEPGRYYGSPDPCTTVVETTVSVLAEGRPSPVGPWIARATVPLDLALSGDGQRLALVAAGNSTVGDLGAEVYLARTEAFTESPGEPDCSTPVVAREVSSGPILPPLDVAAEFPAGSRTIVAYRIDGEPTAVAFDRRGHVVVQTREPATLQLPRLGKTIWLSGESRYDTGHAIFHGNAGRFIACASCHPGGDEDGRVWRFAFSGPRRTQSLRGGISESSPFHWDGDMMDMSHLVADVFVKRMAGPQLASNQLAVLTRWLDSLPHLPPPPVRDAEAVGRGGALFASRGCAGCHAGSRLGSNLSQDVGTGKAFQVPSLRGVAYRAPYMHDGCAATLAARLHPGPCGGDRHGDTGSLSDSERADLAAYLESL